jgi:hypothetical protein
MLRDVVRRSMAGAMRRWLAGTVVALMAGLGASAASAASGGLVVSYDVPAGSPAAAIAGRAWTYDSAVTAAAAAATGRDAPARRILDVLARVQRPDGGFASSYAADGSHPDALLRTGAVAWVGLAAAEYRVAFCTTRYDDLLAGVAHWLLERRVSSPASDARGLLVGGPDVNWVSTEHNLEARAFFSRLDDDAAAGRGACAAPLAGMGSALRTQVAAAVIGLDEGIQRELFVPGGPGGSGAFFGQGLDDRAHPVDAQAMGIQWLLGRGRTEDARAVAATADAMLLVAGRRIDGRDGAGAFTGYKPYAEAWGPDVLWMEGTLQMRMAKAALGQDVAALDDSADRWAALTSGGMLLHADREVVGNPAGDYHVWPAAAPAAWLALSRSGSDLLR